jgi:hypothetical protein
MAVMDWLLKAMGNMCDDCCDEPVTDDEEVNG